MQIRKATTKDKDALIKLLTELDDYTQHHLSEIQRKIRAYKDPVKTAMETVEKYFSNENSYVFVADDGDELKGFISGTITHKADRVYNKEGYIEKWYMKESGRAKGVGKKLFDRMLDEFKKANCTHIGLDTHIENQTAVSIYEHMGLTKRLVTFFMLLKDLG